MTTTQIKRNQINGGVANAPSIGLVPNLESARAANTATLIAALAVGSGISVIEFPDADSTDTDPYVNTGTIYYFESFTIPQKPITLRGFATQRGNSNTILDFLPSGTVCITADVDTDLASHNRFSRFEGLVLREHTPTSGSLVKTMFYINNGGLMVHNVWITQCNIGFEIKASFGGSYTIIGVSATAAGFKFTSDARNNNFTTLALNNATRDGNTTSSSSLICKDGIGLWIGIGVGGELFTENTIQNLDTSACGIGVYVNAASCYANNFMDYYAEENFKRNVQYSRTGGRFGDFWANYYYGTGMTTAVTASITTTTMTVTAGEPSGGFVAGQTVTGSGVTAGTTITIYVSPGVYTISPSQTVGSGSMTIGVAGDVVPANGADALDTIDIIAQGQIQTRVFYAPRYQFPATQVASSNVNTLDDYEEGTWQPQFADGGAHAITMGSTSQGAYTKIGRVVVATGTAIISSIAAGPLSGNLELSGLPFTADLTAPATQFNSVGSIYGAALAATMTTTLGMTLGYGSNVIGIQKTNGAGSWSACAADFQANSYINFSLTFFAST